MGKNADSRLGKYSMSWCLMPLQAQVPYDLVLASTESDCDCQCRQTSLLGRTNNVNRYRHDTVLCVHRILKQAPELS